MKRESSSTACICARHDSKNNGSGRTRGKKWVRCEDAARERAILVETTDVEDVLAALEGLSWHCETRSCESRSVVRVESDLLDLLEVSVGREGCRVEEDELELAGAVESTIGCVGLDEACHLWVELEEATVCACGKALLG